MILEIKVQKVIPVKKVIKAYKVNRVSQVHKDNKAYKANKVQPVHKAFKAFKVNKVSQVHKVFKVYKASLVHKAHKEDPATKDYGPKPKPTKMAISYNGTHTCGRSYAYPDKHVDKECPMASPSLTLSNLKDHKVFKAFKV